MERPERVALIQPKRQNRPRSACSILQTGKTPFSFNRPGQPAVCISAKTPELLPCGWRRISGLQNWPPPLGKRADGSAHRQLGSRMFDRQTFDIVKCPLPGLGAILSAALVQDPLTKLENADFPATAADAAASATLRDRTRALLAASLDGIFSAYFKQEQ